MNKIKFINLNNIDLSKFTFHGVECVVLTQDRKILLQQRGSDWRRFPGYLSNYGGQIESNETPLQALIRELNEELGAEVDQQDLIRIATITEAVSNHTELIHIFFWHDKNGTITGCYEGEARYFESVTAALNNPKVMDSVRFSLQECQSRGLI